MYFNKKEIHKIPTINDIVIPNTKIPKLEIMMLKVSDLINVIKLAPAIMGTDR